MSQSLSAAYQFSQVNLFGLAQEELLSKQDGGCSVAKPLFSHLRRLVREVGITAHAHDIADGVFRAVMLERINTLPASQSTSYEDIKAAWASFGVEGKPWDALSEEEKVDWASHWTARQVVSPSEVVMRKCLENAEYFVGDREAAVRPDFPGKYMVKDRLDDDGFAVVGDNLTHLIALAYEHVIDA